MPPACFPTGSNPAILTLNSCSSVAMTIDTLASSLATLALTPPSAARLALAAQVADAGRRHLAPVPSWVTGYLERCLMEARIACLPKEQLVEPLLTLHLLTGREAYEREAITLINSYYRQIATFVTQTTDIIRTSDLVTLTSDLYIVVTCCDYVEDYDPSLVLSAYHRLTSLLETSAKALAPSQRAKLAELSEQLALSEAV